MCVAARGRREWWRPPLQSEVFAIVKDLVLENRTKVRYRLISAVIFLLLLVSLGANFGLVVWGVELSKEAHVTALQSPGAPAASASVIASADDPNAIVATAAAKTTLGAWVAPELEPSAFPAGEVEVEFEEPDYEGVAQMGADAAVRRRRRLTADDDSTSSGPAAGRRMRLMKIDRIERLSETSVRLHGADAREYVEIADGEATAVRTGRLSELTRSPFFDGSRTQPSEPPPRAGSGFEEADPRPFARRWGGGVERRRGAPGAAVAPGGDGDG